MRERVQEMPWLTWQPSAIAAVLFAVRGMVFRRARQTMLTESLVQAATEMRRAAEVQVRQEEKALDAWEDGLRKAARRARLLGGTVELHELEDLRLTEEQLGHLREAGILALREPPPWQEPAPAPAGEA